MSGPALPLFHLVFVAGLCGAIWSVREPGPDHLGAVIRATAFTSAVPFVLAFAAAALHRLRRGPVTRWLVANRRYLGLSVAASHFWHLVAIVVLIRRYSGEGEPIPTITLVFGGAGFVALGLMAATSNDASQRRLGRAWRWLHLVGVYVLWIDFIVTYSGPVSGYFADKDPLSPFHVAMTLIFALAWMLRVVAYWAPR
jgi:DMSO/TMAO reductase YedYZ heme-binding membrane subunit